MVQLGKLLYTIALGGMPEFQQEVQDAKNEVTDSSNVMVDGFKKIGAAVAAYMTVDKIIDFGKAAVDAAATIAAETSAFEQIMGDYTDTAREKMSAVADTTGVVDTRLTQYMTSMSAKFKGLGFDIDDATDLAATGLTMASDAAAFWDKSLDESMSHLNSFINGSYEGGEAIGLFANDTQMAMYAVESGLIGATKEWANLDEKTKQATRLEYALNMQQMSGVVGQAAKESDQYANVMGNLSEKWRQFLGVVGEPILQNIVIPAASKLSEAIDVLSTKVKEGFEKWSELKAWFTTITDYATEKFEPILQDLKTAFEFIKDALKPLIDKFSEYVSSGELVEDITDALKDAIDFLTDAYTAVRDIIIDTIDWMREHETATQTLAIMIGALTTAVAAYNVVQAIKRAGGLAEIAEMALLTIQVYALDAAQLIATVSTTAFGVAINFLTSPITLVILAIGALIAIGVLLWKNWDEIKAKAIEFVGKLTEKFEELKNSISDKFEAIKNSIKEKIEWARDKVEETVEKIKGLFKFEWSLPKPKIPSFSVSGGEAPWGFLGKGSLPSVSISWFAKGGILEEPTVFGVNGNTLMAGGEAGPEAVAPISELQKYLYNPNDEKQTAMLEALLSILDVLSDDDRLKDVIVDAIVNSNLTFKVGEREFGRLVREHA